MVVVTVVAPPRARSSLAAKHGPVQEEVAELVVVDTAAEASVEGSEDSAGGLWSSVGFAGRQGEVVGLENHFSVIVVLEVGSGEATPFEKNKPRIKWCERARRCGRIMDSDVRNRDHPRSPTFSATKHICEKPLERRPHWNSLRKCPYARPDRGVKALMSGIFAQQPEEVVDRGHQLEKLLAFRGSRTFARPSPKGSPLS